MGRFRGIREERTEHTQLFSRTLVGFGSTWHQKVHFSTFDGKLELQCTRNGPQNLHFVHGLSRAPLLFIPRYLTNIFPENIFNKKNLENRNSENLKFQKPRFTNKCPGLSSLASMNHLAHLGRLLFVQRQQLFVEENIKEHQGRGITE